MEITAVLYFLRKGVKLHFYSLGTIFEENIWGVQRGVAPWLWVSNRYIKPAAAISSRIAFSPFPTQRESSISSEAHSWRVPEFCGLRFLQTRSFCSYRRLPVLRSAQFPQKSQNGFLPILRSGEVCGLRMVDVLRYEQTEQQALQPLHLQSIRTGIKTMFFPLYPI